MNRWWYPLLTLGLWACIEDVEPLADPDGCDEDACGAAPLIGPCPDGASSRLTCEPQADGACGWTIGECPPIDPEPSPGPPIQACTPDACGPQPDGAACPPGETPMSECVDDAGQCRWDVRCAPDNCCDPNAIPAGEPCPPGFDGTLECVGCEWILGCEPNGMMCRPEDCGPTPEGEPCAPDERRVEACETTPQGCQWSVRCESFTCEPEDCPQPFPGPQCPDFEATCEPMGGVCGWRIECLDICALPFEVGDCNAAEQVWWFNAQTGLCEERQYGGCGGNDNRFGSPEECFAACGVLGGEEPGCEPLGPTRLVAYEHWYCDERDPDGGEGDPDGGGEDEDPDGVVDQPPQLVIQPAAPCAVAQLTFGADALPPPWQRTLTAEGQRLAQALVEGVEPPFEPQEIPCGGLARLQLLIAGEPVTVELNRHAPHPALAGVVEFAHSVHSALENCTEHPALSPCMRE